MSIREAAEKLAIEVTKKHGLSQHLYDLADNVRIILMDERAKQPQYCLVCKKGPLKNVRRHMRRQHHAWLGWDDMLDFDSTGQSGFWTYIYD